MRTSSNKPANHSPQTELPPIRRTPVDVGIVPVITVVVTSAPFT